MSESEPLPKQELLIKLMNMTSSSNDGEALTAVRLANKLLLDNKWSWEKLVHSKIKVIADPFKDIPIRKRRPTPTMDTPDRPSPSPRPQQKMWNPPPPPRPQHVRPLLPPLNDREKFYVRNGRLIEAIKEYRTHVNCGLAEAEQKVDEFNIAFNGSAANGRPVGFKSPKRTPLDRQTTADLLNQSMPPVSPTPKTEFFSAKPKRPANGGPSVGEL